MQLAVLNQSTLVSAETVAKVVDACDKQIRLHVAPQWSISPALVVHCQDEASVPLDAHRLTILDDADERRAFGYHRVTPAGQPYARVFVRRIFNHAGELLTGSLSVSSVISHEICEWFVNPYLARWVDGPEGQYSVEICDPVDGDVYEIDGVSVSNFVTRHFFDPRPPLGVPFDHLGKLIAPFSTTTRGHMHIRKPGSDEAVRCYCARRERER